MKVYLTGKNRVDTGGGFSFNANIQKALPDVDWIDNENEADLIFVTGITLIESDDLLKAGAPIVLRVDNLPTKSKNPRTDVLGRLRAAGKLSQHIIYQSKWAKDYVGYFMERDRPSTVIYNGADTKYFNRDQRVKHHEKTYLYIGRKGEPNKRKEEALHHFHMCHRQDKSIRLVLAGAYDRNFISAGFDFVDSEKIEFLGNQVYGNMHLVYKNADVLLAPYFNDACSNTIIEARHCGLDIWTGTGGSTGGTPEIINEPLDHLTLDYMGERYMEIFNGLSEH